MTTETFWEVEEQVAAYIEGLTENVEDMRAVRRLWPSPENQQHVLDAIATLDREQLALDPAGFYERHGLSQADAREMVA